MDDFDTLIESIRGSYPSDDFFKQITLTFNPWHENHFLKREVFDKETQRRDTLALTTTFRVNEWLDESDRQRLEDLRSEEHTSELQSRGHLVCRLLLEKKS